jgi:hypothetical protein
MKIKFLLISLSMILLVSCSLATIMDGFSSEDTAVEVSERAIITATMESLAVDPSEPTQAAVPAETAAPPETTAPTATEMPPEAPATLIDAAEAVLQALYDRDLDTLSQLVHPVMGVRFTPLAYIEDIHLVFLPDEIPGLFESSTVYVWGYDHMAGNPFKYTFSAYYDRFIFHVDYTEAEEIGINEQVHSGHQLNNIAEFYPSSQFVEYHFGWDAFPDLFTWKSLRLVFIEENGSWWLIGIVNDEWGG